MHVLLEGDWESVFHQFGAGAGLLSDAIHCLWIKLDGTDDAFWRRHRLDDKDFDDRLVVVFELDDLKRSPSSSQCVAACHELPFALEQVDILATSFRLSTPRLAISPVKPYNPPEKLAIRTDSRSANSYSSQVASPGITILGVSLQRRGGFSFHSQTAVQRMMRSLAIAPPKFAHRTEHRPWIDIVAGEMHVEMAHGLEVGAECRWRNFPG